MTALRTYWPLIAIFAFIALETAVCCAAVSRMIDRQPAQWSRT